MDVDGLLGIINSVNQGILGSTTRAEVYLDRGVMEEDQVGRIADVGEQDRRTKSVRSCARTIGRPFISCPLLALGPDIGLDLSPIVGGVSGRNGGYSRVPHKPKGSWWIIVANGVGKGKRPSKSSIFIPCCHWRANY